MRNMKISPNSMEITMRHYNLPRTISPTVQKVGTNDMPLLFFSNQFKNMHSINTVFHRAVDTK